MLYVPHPTTLTASRRPSATTVLPDDVMTLTEFVREGVEPPRVYKSRPASTSYAAGFPLVPTEDAIGHFRGCTFAAGKASCP